MNNVLTLRNKLSMTQDVFADYCGLSRISIARYEANGKIGRENAERIAKACNVSVDYVLGLESEQSEPKREPPRLTEEDLAAIASIVNPKAESPRTVEARIVSFGMDKISQEKRDMILGMIRGMFKGKPEAEFFEDKRGDKE